MSEKKVLLAIYLHENSGIEIEINADKGDINAITLVGLLEQIKFDIIRQHAAQNTEQQTVGDA